MTKRLLTLLFSLIILEFSSISAYSLSYEDVINSLSNAFSSFIDPNAGTSTFRILNIPSGGRSEAMGSAFTGLANDVTYLEYNAAASSVLTNSELGIFHNSWISDASMDSVAYTFRKNNFGFGAGIKCFYVEFIERDFFEDVAKDYYSETVGTLNFSYNFFSGYDFKGMAVGLNLKGAYRSMPNYTDSATSKIIPKSGLLQSGVAVMADLGIQMRFNLAKFYTNKDPNFQVGISASNFGASFTNLGSPNGVKLDDPLPSKFAFGLSYRPVKPFTVTLEFQQPLNVYNPSLSEKWSIGTGMMVQFTNFFALQGGFLLKGANPRFSLGAEFLISKFIINLNYTFDFTSSATPVNRISVAAKINLGDSGREKRDAEVERIYIEGLKRYAAGEMKEAINCWTRITGGVDLDGNTHETLDKFYEPARKGISAARETLDLQEKLKNASFF